MKNNQNFEWTFQEQLIHELSDFQFEQKEKFPADDNIKIDLHCHDHNSNVPDELLGRILNVPETWLKTERLIKSLRKSECDVITITNHNNARSCFELLEKGIDVLVGAEFSCTVPDYNIGIHVLTYGFNEKQERELNKLRKNIYAFREYTAEHNIPVIWAHPLYHYSSDKLPSLEFFNKMALVFDCFEVINGQRDTWQNMLVKVWLEGLTPEKINEISKKTGIRADQYCRNPYKKSMSGGSDSHMGIFAGQTGSILHVPNLTKKLKTTAPSLLALEAIRRGNIMPYGSHQNNEKLMITFLDYVCQIALYGNDPGLLRILLHKGTTKDKMIALLISNAFAELRHHKVTMNFIELFHNSFAGKSPGFAKRFFVSRDYKHVFDDAMDISKIRANGSNNTVEDYKKSIYSINNRLNSILFGRLDKKIHKLKRDGKLSNINFSKILEKLEMPSEIRTYIDKDNKNKNKDKKISNPDLTEFLDGLSFPFLASSLILASNFISAKVMYNDRPLLEEFSKQLGHLQNPKRMLWLTDTFEDNNGVSMVLKAMHAEIKEHNLPIDIIVCSNTLQPDDNLIVLKPLAEFTLPIYEQQPVRVPNFLDIHKIFQDGGYDRVICSTEGIMGLASIYLKNAFNVKAHFFVHTDWIVFVKKVLNIDQSNHNRFRRLLRAYYKNFDSLFVLNTDQQKWLTGREMGFETTKVHLTAHWADAYFSIKAAVKKGTFNITEDSPVILFAGRLSKEKGVMELPEIFMKVKKYIPEVKLVIAGTGPAESDIREALPDAVFLGWVNHEDLPFIYSAADLLILPSKFDTFSCVVLESLSCGLPVIAYKTKGPKDIIQNGKCGFIVSNKNEMCEKIIGFLKDPKLQKAFRRQALKRSKDYNKDKIMKQFLHDVDLSEYANNYN
jgi:glycosyltransferase involved in cell wall biosynthesis